jgi:2-hydroxy-3-keto-5-methylthiopentenyl-1-phosphate phosphatase
MTATFKQINLFKTKLVNGTATEKQKIFFMKKIEEFEESIKEIEELMMKNIKLPPIIVQEQVETITEEVIPIVVEEQVIIEFVINPDTNKKVKIGGRLYKKLKKENKL